MRYNEQIKIVFIEGVQSDFFSVFKKFIFNWRIVRAFEMDIYFHTAIFNMCNQQGPTVKHMELCSMLCGSLDERGVRGRMDIVYIWLSVFAAHLKLSQHC